MWPFRSGPVIPVLRLTGTIGMLTPLRPGLSIAALAGPIEKAFAMSKASAVAVIVNSPGGSPVQSSLIFRRIRQLAEENEKKVFVFCEDIAASGGYYVALAGDEIFADASSIIGSIGVISAGFGFDKIMQHYGIDRRVYTAGENKGSLDPFLPEKADDVARLKALQRDVHDVFIGIVKERRAGRLKSPDAEIFSGAFWSAAKALEYGLIDGISDVRQKMRELYGEKVRLKLVPIEKGGLLSRVRRLPTLQTGDSLEADSNSLAADVVSAIEARTHWSRFGL